MNGAPVCRQERENSNAPPEAEEALVFEWQPFAEYEPKCIWAKYEAVTATVRSRVMRRDKISPSPPKYCGMAKPYHSIFLLEEI